MWNSTVKSLVFVSLMGLPLISGATEIEDMSSATEVVKKRVPVKIEGKKLLSLRVLTRPFSNIYADKSIESAIVQGDVPALQPFYVYTRPSAEDLELEAGWYEIGSNSQGKVIGWMQSKDVLQANAYCKYIISLSSADAKMINEELTELVEEKWAEAAERGALTKHESTLLQQATILSPACFY